MRDRHYLRQSESVVNGALTWLVIGLGVFQLLVVIVAVITTVRMGHAVSSGTMDWIVVGVVMVAGCAVAIRRWRRLREVDAATAGGDRLPCLHCGYALTLNERVCPECGGAVVGDHVRGSWARFRKRAGLKTAWNIRGQYTPPPQELLARIKGRGHIIRAYLWVNLPAVLLTVAVTLTVVAIVAECLFRVFFFVPSYELIKRLFVDVPLKMVAVIVLLACPPAVIARRRTIKRLKPETVAGGPMPCLECGYTLLLNERTSTCPECGVAVDEEEVRREWAAFRTRARMEAAGD